MTHHFVQEIRRLLVAFHTVQQKLFAIYEQKYSAMRASDLKELNRCLKEENRCNTDFQELMRTRKDLISRAESVASGVKTLVELIERIAGENRVELLGLVSDLKSQTGKLRSQSWVHWIVAQRGFHHYSQILELIANFGKKSPTYDHANPLAYSGGAILDTSA